MKRVKLHIIAIILILALGLIAYGNTLKNGFVFDDIEAVKDNAFITSFDNLRHFFDSDYYLASGETSWRVAVTLSFFIDYQLWNFRPFGFHLTNLVFHLLNGVLFYIFLIYLIPLIDKNISENRLDYIQLPLLAALLFISHPIQSEAVNAIGFRHEVMYSFFFLASIIFYLKAKLLSPKKRTALYSFSLLCYFLAMTSKETAIVLPIAIILIEVFSYMKDKTKKLIHRENLLFFGGYFIVLGIYVWIRFFWLVLPEEKVKTIFYEAPFMGGNFGVWFLTTSEIFASYIRLFLLPVNLSAEYMISACYSILDPLALASFLILVAFLVIIFQSVRRFPIIAFSGFWIFIPLIAVSNIIPLHHPMAERYLYLSTAGFSLMLAYGLNTLFSFSDKRWLKLACKSLAIIIIVTLLFLYSAKTITRNKTWRDEKTFWATIVNKPGPHLARAHTSMGVVFMKEEKLDKAVESFEKSLDSDPSYYQAYNNLGLVYYKRGDYDKAIENYQKIIDLKIHLAKYEFIKVYSNLGLAYTKKGMPDKAIEIFKKALDLNPYLAGVYFNLGSAYKIKGMLEEAIGCNEKALELNPNLIKPYYALGVIFLEKGMHEEAKEKFEKTVQLFTGFAPGYYGLAQYYYHKKDYNRAMEYLKKSSNLGFMIPAEFLGDLQRAMETP